MSEDNENQKQKEITFTPIQISWRVFLWEVFLFCLTLVLGIATAFRMNKTFEIQKITTPKISFWQFIFYFLFTTLFILFLIYFVRFKRGKGVLFKTLFIMAVFFGGLLLLGGWIKTPIPLIILLFLVLWWLRKPSVLNQDILMILGMAGVGSFLGLSLKPEIVIGLLIVFSVYDFIAVYKTKHMVKMAKEMIKERAILALIIPQNISNFRESLESVQPGGKFLILGGGDIVFPLLFCSSLVPEGILNPLIVAIFSLIGLFVGFYIFISQKVRQPIPALPPIAVFSILGYLIAKLMKL